MQCNVYLVNTKIPVGYIYINVSLNISCIMFNVIVGELECRQLSWFSDTCITQRLWNLLLSLDWSLWSTTEPTSTVCGAHFHTFLLVQVFCIFFISDQLLKSLRASFTNEGQFASQLNLRYFWQKVKSDLRSTNRTMSSAQLQSADCMVNLRPVFRGLTVPTW